MRAQLAVTLLVAIVGICTAQGGPFGPLVPDPIPGEPLINPADFQPALDANRAKWAAQNIQAYKFKQRRSCFCLRESIGPFDVIVFRNKVISAVFSQDSGLTGVPRFTDALQTVEDAFDDVQEILNMDPPVTRLSVSYDAELGYITNFFVDVRALLADEERGASFENLEPIFKLPSGFPGPQFSVGGD